MCVCAYVPTLKKFPIYTKNDEKENIPCSYNSTWKIRENIEICVRLLMMWVQSLIFCHGWLPG